MALQPILVLAVAAVALLLFLIPLGALVKASLRRAGPGQALIAHGVQSVRVSFNTLLVMPVIHRAWSVELVPPPIVCELTGRDGLSCRDGIRADLRATFRLRVNETPEDVIKVSRSLGYRNTTNPEVLDWAFRPKFEEGLRTVGAVLTFAELRGDGERFRDAVINVIGEDLNGIFLDSLTLDHLEQTPADQLDPTRIADAQGLVALAEQRAELRAQAREREKAEALAAAERAQERALGERS